MQQTKKHKQQPIAHKGQLTLLSLALSGALAAMVPASLHAQQVISGLTTAQTWSAGDLSVDSTGTIIPSGNSDAITATGLLGTLSNSGFVYGGTSGVANYNGTISLLSNDSGATISGTYNGIYNSNTITTLNNAGSVNGASGINNIGSIGSLSNSGTIAGTGVGGASAIKNAASGTISNLSNDGGVINGANYAIYNAGSIGTLSNSGIASGIIGIENSGGSIGLLSNDSGGTISGGTISGGTGILTYNGSIATLNNAGVLSGTNGIVNANGTIDTFINSGTILGSTAASNGVSLGVNNTGTIVNFNNDGGTISGTVGVKNTGRIIALTNSGYLYGSTLNGRYALDNLGTIDALTNSGTISAVFGILNDSTLSSIGTIINTGLITGVGSGFGISNQGTISVLSNDVGGTIYSGVNGGYGINNSNVIGTLSNSGLIGGGTGVSNSGTISILTNSGNIIAANNGIINDGGIGTLTNDSGRTIAGSTAGIYNAGSIAALSNSGSISAVAVGLWNAYGSIASVNNSGTITGASGVFNTSTISTLTNSGVISGAGLVGTGVGGFAGIGIGIGNYGTIDTLNNSGTIVGSGSTFVVSGFTIHTGGIYNYGVINALNNSIGGVISGVSNGLANDGVIGTLSNAGTISGSINGILNSGTISALENTGSISTLKNLGLIGGVSAALVLDSGSSLGILNNGGVIAGSITNDSANVLTITGGSGTIFGVLTGASAGLGSSAIGSITSATDVYFGTGNQLLNDNITVNGGTGTVTSGGVLQVNNVISINGNYAQSAGSTLILGVTSPVFNGDLSDSGYGRLVVSGDAVLASGSSVSLKTLGYAFAQGQRYVVLAAGGTIAATGVNYSATGYSVTGSIQGDTLSSGYTDLILTLGSATSTTPINNATNINATSALSGLFNYAGTNPLMLGVFNPAAALSTADAANRAGARLSPGSVRSATTQAVNASSAAVNNVVNDRMDGIRVAQNGGGVATGERTRDIGLWGQVFGGRAAQGMRDNVSGYHANFRGSLLGADGLVSDVLRVGGLVSVSKTSVASDGDNVGSSADINNYGLTAYATYDGAPWYVNVQAGVARQKFSTVRDISYTGFAGMAYGNFNGSQYQSSVQAGYPLNLDAWLPGATLTPIAGLSYSNLRQNGYTESGGNGAALTINASSSTSVKSELGAKLERGFESSYGKLLPSVQLGWRHEFKDGATQSGASFAADSTGATAFVAHGATPQANLGVLNLGVTLLRSQNLSLTGKYTLEAGGGYTAQTASVQVRWRY